MVRTYCSILMTQGTNEFPPLSSAELSKVAAPSVIWVTKRKVGLNVLS